MLISGNTPLGYPSKAYVWFLLLALVPQLMGHHLLARIPAARFHRLRAGCTTLLAFFAGETPTTLKLFGAILILFGIYIASRGESTQSTER
jgi:drug/metabolite transporter (DMT)-like permease